MLSTTPRRPSRTSKRPSLHAFKERAVLRAALFLCWAKWHFAQVKKLIVCAALVVASCRDQHPPQPTAEQSAQLNEAEDLLDNMAANEEGPADRSTGPSNSTD